ncbi:MAG: divalent cation transporter [Gammaproteobacteria bacterium]|nr:divalent cation transporter [Gammaproteobacteria bacterium]
MATNQQLINVIYLTLIAGLAMPLGAILAQIEQIKPRWLDEELKHGIIAFGGGALLSAVALVLVPQGIEGQSLTSASLYFCGGGFAFMLIDIVLDKLNTPASQLAAMLSDFIPEALALGAALAIGSSSALLLAGLMALQNLPEGFNAYRELKESSSYSGNRIIMLFTLMSLIGPLSGIAGFLYLADKPEAVASIMLFASGGILYSVFQDIAPQAKLNKHWLPAMGAILGFMLGLLGHMSI